MACTGIAELSLEQRDGQGDPSYSLPVLFPYEQPNTETTPGVNLPLEASAVSQ